MWFRLKQLRALKRLKKKDRQPVVGVLGCMAERLKTQLLESDHACVPAFGLHPVHGLSHVH